MLIDLDLDAGSTYVVHHRPDGTATISIPQTSFEKAARLLFSQNAAVERLVTHEPTGGIQ
jgi:hypothetical protein